MPCNLTKGKDLTCRDTTGGVKNMYFTNYDATLNTTVTRSATGAITDYAAITFYKYVMPRGTSGFDQTINTSLENGTTFYEGTLTSILNGLTQEDLNELQLLVVGTPHVVNRNTKRYVLPSSHPKWIGCRWNCRNRNSTWRQSRGSPCFCISRACTCSDRYRLFKHCKRDNSVSGLKSFTT